MAVQLAAASGSVITATTDVNGEYGFDEPGGRRLHRDGGCGYPAPALNFLTTRYPHVVTLHDAEVYTGADIGFKGNGVMLGDTIWYDANADGRQDGASLASAT